MSQRVSWGRNVYDLLNQPHDPFKSRLFVETNPEPLVPVLQPILGAEARDVSHEPVIRPDWLPDDWDFTFTIRASGRKDNYFISPAGTRFRSKTEVLHFLEHGTKRKKTAESGSVSTPAAASSSPAQKKEKKPKRSGKKENGNASVPGTEKAKWSEALNRVTEVEKDD